MRPLVESEEKEREINDKLKKDLEVTQKTDSFYEKNDENMVELVELRKLTPTSALIKMGEKWE